MSATRPHPHAATAVASGLFGFLNRQAVPYVVLGDGWTRSAASIELVLASPALASLPRRLRELARARGLRFVQHGRGRSGAWTSVLAWHDDAEELRFLRVHAGDRVGSGARVLSAGEILEGSSVASGSDGADGAPRVPRPRMEFLALLAERLDRGQLDADDASCLTRCWREDPAGIREQLRRLWGDDDAASITRAAESGEWADLRADLRSLRARRRPDVARGTRRAIDTVARAIDRIVHPPGLWVGFLGPDGSGKSTTLERVQTRLAPLFGDTKRYHLRPHVGRRKPGPAGPPDRTPPRGPIGSLIKLAYWWIDYAIGYGIGIFPSLVSSSLVLFDRHYLDLGIDPARYRYGGPAWLARIVGRSIPRPELFLVLDAPAEILWERKGELSRSEAETQAREYRKLAEANRRTVLVDTSASPERCVLRCERAILDHLERRVERRCGWPSAGADRRRSPDPGDDAR